MIKSLNYFLSIWPTDGCNKRCQYCFYGISDIFTKTFQPKRMNEKTADAIVNFINDGHVCGVSFFGAEPLLNWKIVKRILARSHLPLILKHSKVGRTAYNITTNATLLTENIAEELKLHDVFVNISFDGLPEQQNAWRDGSYDVVVKNLQFLSGYPKLQALKTLATPETIYEDVEHIRDVGFKQVYINLLDPFGRITYEDKDHEKFKQDYKRVIKELHNPPKFIVADYQKWGKMLKPGRPRSLGCGFVNRGLGVGPEGFFYPCHEGPTLNNRERFRIGDVFHGVDEQRAKKVRSVRNSPLCQQCEFQLSKCYVTMYNKHGRFGVDAPLWHRRFEVAKLEAIGELDGWPLSRSTCIGGDREPHSELLLATVMSKDKQFLLKPFLSSILSLQLPVITDYVIVIDSTDERLHHLLQTWKEGKAIGLPNPQEKFRSIKIIKMPVIQGERFMWRIARGRNIVLGIARKTPLYSAYMFLDADVIAPPDALMKLWSVDDGIVGALVKCRRDDREGWYNIYCKKDGIGYHKIRDFKAGEILYVDATGSDCILVRRSIFIDQIYSYKPEIPEAEDIGFCRQARERGFNVRVHTGVKVHHVRIGDVEVRE